MDALKSKGQMLDQINLEQIPRSGFDLSYNNKGTGKIGRIIPIRCMETLPGDSIKGSTQIAMQFEPLAVPILANMRLKSETWYCPNHILWDGWDNFITKGQDLSDTSKVPSFTLVKCLTEVINQVTGQFPAQCLTGDLSVYVNGSTTASINNTLVCIDNIILAVKNMRNKLITPRTDQTDDLLDYTIPIIDDYLAYLDNYLSEGYRLNIPRDNPNIQDVEYYFGDNLLAVRFAPMFRYKTEIYNGVSYLPMSYGDEAEHWGYVGSDNVGNKNLTEYDLKLYSYLKDKQISEHYYFVPSDFAVRFFHFFYDMIKPFVGLGSNLDYLGYRTYTPLEAYFMFTASLNEDFQHRQDDSEGNVVPSSQFITKTFFFGEYFGGQMSSGYGSSMSILPLRALYAIWWNNYRDQLLETAAPEPCSLSSISSDELWHLLCPRLRCWSKDTFTTSLANTGTGNMVVPISNSLSGYRTAYDFANDTKEDILDLDKTSFKLSDGTQIDLPTRFIDAMHSKKSGGTYLKYGFSLDMLRRAGRTEKWIQKALIYGNRIQDALFTHWGVKIKNERIQLPEFVTSSVQMVKIDTILNNTTTSESVAGDKAGFASAYDEGNGFDFYSPENGILLSLMSILPEQSYSGGVPRFISKLSIFDFAFPEFAQIGMDAVYMNEIATLNFSLAADKGVDNEVFGYQGRYYDYKCKQDEEHGELKSTQDMYTFSRTYNMYDVNSRPKLNYRFVHCHPSLDMFVVDDQSQDQFRYDIHHSVACSRALPVCGMSV